MKYNALKHVTKRDFLVKPRSGQPNVVNLYLDIRTKSPDDGRVEYWLAADFAVIPTELFELTDEQDAIPLHIREAAQLRDALNDALAHTIYAKPTGDLTTHENPQEGR